MLPITPQENAALKHWLLLGIGALALAGLFAVLLVAARSPVVQDILPVQDIFTKALTVHVNLSVLVWFLSLACVFWQVATPSQPSKLDRFIILAALAGVVIFVLSPFLQEGDAYLNNYVPILDNTPFIWGIGIFLSTVMAQALVTVARFAACKNSYAPDITLFRRASIASALIYICSFFALIFSYIGLSNPELGFGAVQFYESFFWGGGHIMQFLYVQVMMLAWWWLAQPAGFTPRNIKFYTVVFSINLLVSIGSLASYALYPAYEPEHISLFTAGMRHFGGLAPILFGIPFLAWLIRHWRNVPRTFHHWVLAWSMFMFGIGGALGYRIDGVNTIIPAHYHGSIVGVTLALMGMAYTVLPKLGFSLVHKKILTLQPFVYGIGQLLHITGLAWSGGYGALRKTPGAMQSFEGQAAMGLMGLGGLLSVIGGLLFVVICAGALLAKRGRKN